MYKIPEPHPNLSRNGFDLSCRKIMSAPAGALLPAHTIEANPGEKFRISVNDLVRAQPLNTAAFARCKEYYHFFFVPYPSLWRHFDEFITGTNDGYTSAVADDSNYQYVPRYVPRFNYGTLMQQLDKYLHPDKSHPGVDVVKDSMGYDYSRGAYRLLNLLGYGCTSDGKFASRDDKGNIKYVNVYTGATGSDGATLTPSLLRALAYQRIYSDFYRNKQWEAADVASFNVDFMNEDSKSILYDDAVKCFQLRYRQLPKDLITSSIPTPTYDKSIFSLPSVLNIHSSVSRSDDATGVNIAPSGGSQTGIPLPGGSGVADSKPIISTSDIRSAFALEKMLEATRRANGLDYASQIAAHYGFDVPDSRRPRAKFIGGFDNSISISEVVSTGAGSAFNDQGKPITSSVTGQVFGKGLGYMNSGPIEFVAPEHGVIMCVYSVMPQLDYNAYSLDPFNRKMTREDFFQPEFQDLGMVPVLGSDICMQAAGTVEKFKENMSAVVGYNLRYNEYKQSRDMVYGEFMTNKSLSAWTTPKIEPYVKDSKPTLTSASFKVNPNMLDSIFAVNYDGTVKTDQFLVNMYFDVKAVRSMSVTGLPHL